MQSVLKALIRTTILHLLVFSARFSATSVATSVLARSLDSFRTFGFLSFEFVSDFELRASDLVAANGRARLIRIKFHQTARNYTPFGLDPQSLFLPQAANPRKICQIKGKTPSQSQKNTQSLPPFLFHPSFHTPRLMLCTSLLSYFGLCTLYLKNSRLLSPDF